MRALCIAARVLVVSGLHVSYVSKDPKSKLHCMKYPYTPTECGPNDRFSNEELKAGLMKFKDAWARHPGATKMGANHQFAEWFLVKTLKPSAIIESGVLHGGATWGLRDAAGPDTPIFSLDPVDQTSKGFRDSNPNTKYFMNEDWKDISTMDWDTLIPRENRSRALVILDDHQIFFDRFKTLKELGFRHVFVEDNNRYGYGNTSPNFFCTKAELNKDAYKQNWGITDVLYNSPWGDVKNVKTAGKRAADPLQKKTITWAEHENNANWVRANLKSYFEFPAIWDVCKQRPSLVDSKDVALYGLPTQMGLPTYDHRYPPYMEIAHDENA